MTMKNLILGVLALSFLVFGCKNEPKAVVQADKTPS